MKNTRLFVLLGLLLTFIHTNALTFKNTRYLGLRSTNKLPKEMLADGVVVHPQWILTHTNKGTEKSYIVYNKTKYAIDYYVSHPEKPIQLVRLSRALPLKPIERHRGLDLNRLKTDNILLTGIDKNSFSDVSSIYKRNSRRILNFECARTAGYLGTKKLNDISNQDYIGKQCGDYGAGIYYAKSKNNYSPENFKLIGLMVADYWDEDIDAVVGYLPISKLNSWIDTTITKDLLRKENDVVTYSFKRHKTTKHTKRDTFSLLSEVPSNYLLIDGDFILTTKTASNKTEFNLKEIDCIIDLGKTGLRLYKLNQSRISWGLKINDQPINSQLCDKHVIRKPESKCLFVSVNQPRAKTCIQTDALEGAPVLQQILKPFGQEEDEFDFILTGFISKKDSNRGNDSEIIWITPSISKMIKKAVSTAKNLPKKNKEAKISTYLFEKGNLVGQIDRKFEADNNIYVYGNISDRNNAEGALKQFLGSGMKNLVSGNSLRVIARLGYQANNKKYIKNIIFNGQKAFIKTKWLREESTKELAEKETITCKESFNHFIGYVKQFPAKQHSLIIFGNGEGSNHLLSSKNGEGTTHTLCAHEVGSVLYHQHLKLAVLGYYTGNSHTLLNAFHSVQDNTKLCMHLTSYANRWEYFVGSLLEAPKAQDLSKINEFIQLVLKQQILGGLDTETISKILVNKMNEGSNYYIEPLERKDSILIANPIQKIYSSYQQVLENSLEQNIVFKKMREQLKYIDGKQIVNLSEFVKFFSNNENANMASNNEKIGLEHKTKFAKAVIALQESMKNKLGFIGLDFFKVGATPNEKMYSVPGYCLMVSLSEILVDERD